MAGEAPIRDALTRAHARIGRYRLLTPLGEGGMGVVYLAQDETLGRRVAIKLLAPGLAENAEFRERFVRESRLAASIEHPGIVPIYEAGEDDGQLYLAMRFINGLDLRALLIAEGPFATGRAVDMVGQVAAALDSAHAVGLVHRDVKPANVMVDRTAGGDHCYLTDFGLTKSMSATSGYTATGQFVGTLSYVAPEQLQGGPVRGTADVYALGCVLFECLTGTVPFRREHEVAVMYAHMNEPPPSARERRPELPVGLDHVLARAMAKAAEDRYQSCGELAADARAALAGSHIAPFEPSRARSRRFTRPEPQPVAAPAAPPPPRTPVVVPVPVVAAQPPPPPRSDRRHLKAAAIVALAILLCAGGIVAALVLRNSGEQVSAAKSDAQRILDETTQLNNDLKREVERLKDGARLRDERLRGRLVEYEQRADRLAEEARTQIENAKDLTATLGDTNERLAKVSRRLRVAKNPRIVIIKVERELTGTTTALDGARDQVPDLPVREPDVTGSGRIKPIRLPADATMRVMGADVSAVTGAGDVNGDDFGDLVVTTGDTTYVVFGSDVDTSDVDLNDLGDRGVEIEGATTVNPLGDVDGDRQGDLGVTGDEGLYVVSGTELVDTVDLSLLAPLTDTGTGLAAAGDVNGDDEGDVLVTDDVAGEVSVVYGGGTLGTDGGVEIASSDSDLVGAREAGDLDRDLNGDLIVSTSNGAAYVVYGSSDGGPVDVADLGDGGFEIVGAGFDASFAPAGDFDADGYDDVLVGAGETYVLRGAERGGDPERIEIAGAAGGSVAEAGDVNGSGGDDVLVTTPDGTGYVVYGSDATTVDLADDDSARAIELDSPASSDTSWLSGGSDFDGDESADVFAALGDEVDVVSIGG
jgi:serine/threonine-protein kinase